MATELKLKQLRKNSQRPTQKDIAEAANVHYSTVCLALKNHPSIPVKTRDTIKKIAVKLGYIPDPMLSALAAYRLRKRPPTAFQGTLAWLVNRKDPYEWRNVIAVRRYYEGACARAKELGFIVEIFETGDQGISPKRLSSIFKARNIRGILLCPQPAAHTEMDFPWASFSVVTFGHTLASPRLHSVTPAHYRAMQSTMLRLHQSGYKRIGFVLGSYHDHRMEHHFLASYLAEREILDLEPVPLLMGDVQENPKVLIPWLKKHAPEAIVTGDATTLSYLLKSGWKIPRDVGIACAGLWDPDPLLSGIVEQSLLIGATAVDTLVLMIQHGERGVPEVPRQVHVEGIWNTGKSVRRNTRPHHGMSVSSRT